MTNQVVDIVGIDLGTTNSVIAIPGHFPDKGQVYGPVTILFDEVGRLIQASAVCVLEDGEILVGEDAKAMAENGDRVTRFWKKYMGTEEVYDVGNEKWSPERLSAAMLKKNGLDCGSTTRCSNSPCSHYTSGLLRCLGN